MSVLVVGSVAFDTVTTPFGHKEKILGALPLISLIRVASSRR